jgi:UDP:flavonoid glycosyltransferase YjiC (YdhE family)
VKVLFSCAVGYGPFHTQVPLARALCGAGHEVAFATGASFCPWVATVGFPAYPVGTDASAVLQETVRRFPHWPAGVPPEELLRFYLTCTSAQVATPPILLDLLAIVVHWRPDVIVHDPGEFAAPIAAACGRIPSVNHGWGPVLPMENYRLAAEILAPLWERCKLSPPPLAGMFEHLYLDVCPPSLQAPDIADIENVQSLRPIPVHLPLTSLPAWAKEPLAWDDDVAGRPTVYATLGTVFNNAPGVLAAILDALADQDVKVVLAIGDQGDAALLGRESPTVHVRRYIPQPQVLADCDLVICHGGAGTVLAALDAGVPLLLLPVGLDQFHNARRGAAAGVGRWLPPEERTAEAVGREVQEILGDDAFRDRARALQLEIRAMPGPDAAVARIERLVSSDGSTRPR